MLHDVSFYFACTKVKQNRIPKVLVYTVAKEVRKTHQGLKKFNKEGINRRNFITKNADDYIDFFFYIAVRVFCTARMFIT